MNRDDQHRWYSLRERAYEALRGGSMPRQGLEPVVQLVVLPAFRDAYSLELFRVRGKAEKVDAICGARSTWDMKADYEVVRAPSALPVEKLRQPAVPKPTILRAEVAVGQVGASGVIDRAKGVRLPLWSVAPKIGCDGVSYELSVGTPFANCRFHWWVEASSEWTELDHLKDALISLFGGDYPKG